MRKNDDDILLWIIIILVIASIVGCKPKPEFYINGKPYYTRRVCVESHLELKFMGEPTFETECDKYKTDTIEIKPECLK